MTVRAHERNPLFGVVAHYTKKTIYHYCTATEVRTAAEKGDTEAQRELVIRLSFNKKELPIVNAETLHLAQTILKFQPGLPNYKTICCILLAEDYFAKRNYKMATNFLAKALATKEQLNPYQMVAAEQE